MSLVPIIDHERHQSLRGNSFVGVTCITGLIAAFLFSAFPEIDLAVSRLFYVDQQFLFARPSFGATLRDLLRLLFGVVCVAAVLGFVMKAFFDRKFLKLGMAAWAYVALCAAIGPGIIANLGFKDHWGRARPVHIAEFGGSKQFTPPMLRTDQCARNCAFVSGEASNFYALGFAFAFIFGQAPAHRRKLFLAAIAAGSFAGLIRIGGGGHFLSDVIFAGIFMALVARGLAWLMLERWHVYLAEDGAFHQRTLRAGQRVGNYTQKLRNAAGKSRGRERQLLETDDR